MLLQRLRQFSMVADERSIVAAAARLRIAQPALSRQLATLEREVGVALLVRERRGIRLTPAGDALRRGVAELSEILDAGVQAAVDAQAGTSGAVRLGIARMALDCAGVSNAIATIRREMPGIRLDVAEVNSLDQARALRTRELDVAVGFADHEGDALVKRDVLFEEVMDAVILGATHPLAKRPRVSVAELRDMPCLVLRQGMATGYPQMNAALRDAGINRLEEHATIEALYLLAAAGHGWVIAARSQADVPPYGTVVIPLSDLAFPLPVSLRWRGSDRARATQNVMDVLRLCLSPAAERVAQPTRRVSMPGAPRPNDIELTQLHAFLAAVEEGSMSAAAGRLQVTQSGISRRVSALEHAVGCALVDRATHGVFATSAGEAFRVSAEAAVRLADKAVARAQMAAGQFAGICRIGSMPPELTGGLQNLAMRRVVQELPGIRIELAELLPEKQSELLLAGEIDIGVGGMFPGMEVHPSLSSIQLYEDVVDGVMLVEGHPLASRAWITAGELASEPFLFIDRPRGRRVHDAVMRALAPLGVGRVDASHAGPREIWRAIAGGSGWTIATRAQRSRPPRGLVGVPLEGLNIPWGIGLLWRRDEPDVAVRQVLEIFRTTRNPEIAVVVATVRADRRPATQLAI
jgi:DNA-binding transcriptional LysR family regulator